MFVDVSLLQISLLSGMLCICLMCVMSATPLRFVYFLVPFSDFQSGTVLLDNFLSFNASFCSPFWTYFEKIRPLE